MLSHAYYLHLPALFHEQLADNTMKITVFISIRCNVTPHLSIYIYISVLFYVLPLFYY